MSIIDAILLGLVQGLTEFLPVSSSGHLELAKAIFDVELKGDSNLLLTVILHLATALSTVIIFRKELLQIFKGLFQFKWNDETEFSAKIVLSMVPATFVGLLFEDQIENLFKENILLVGSMLIVTGGLLFLADRAKTTEKGVSYLNALVIGISQAIAILPGISRSGATISTSVLLGVDRTQAAKFSFLMVVPLIFGKIAKDLLSGELVFSSDLVLPVTIGFIAAFISGLVACKWMIQLVRNSNLKYFALYCFIVGAAAIVIKFL